jgi:hypothetical protein
LSYSYRVRRNPLTSTLHIGVERPTAPEPVQAAETDLQPEVAYRDLQAQAKEAGIPANQSRDDLEAALAEADDD